MFAPLHVFLFAVALWSGYAPLDRLTWYLEVLPGFLGWGMFFWFHKKFSLPFWMQFVFAVHITLLFVGGHYTYVDAEWALTEIGLAKATASLLESKTKATYKIDSDVDSLYGILVGNRASEYTLAEAQAKSFAEADYEGTPPDSVQSWADAKGWPATTAADDIIATANAWRQAQGMIRAQRLNRKEQIRVAITIAQVQAVLAAWNMFLSAIKQNLGV